MYYYVLLILEFVIYFVFRNRLHRLQKKGVLHVSFRPFDLPPSHFVSCALLKTMLPSSPPPPALGPNRRVGYGSSNQLVPLPSHARTAVHGSRRRENRH